MGVNSYADSSVVKVAVAVSDFATRKEWKAAGSTTQPFTVLPYTTESFKASKETKMSTAITGSRRQSGSKNMKGSASGGFTIEAALNPLLVDVIIPSALMSDWSGNTPPITAFLTNKLHQLKVTGSTVSGYETSGTNLYVYAGLDENGAPRQVTYSTGNPTAANLYTYQVVSEVNTNIRVGARTVSGNVVSYGNASGFDVSKSTAGIAIKLVVKKYNGTPTPDDTSITVTQNFVKRSYTTFAFKPTAAKCLPVAGNRNSTTAVALDGVVLDGDNTSTTEALTAEVTYTVLGSTVNNGESFSLVNGAFIQTVSAPAGASEVLVNFKLSNGTVVDTYKLPLLYAATKDIIDGTTLKPLLFEKYEKNTVNGVTYHEFNQFFGTCINELSLEFADGDFVKASVTTMSTDFNLSRNSSNASGDNFTGSLASAYVVEPVVDLLDTTDSVKQIVLKDENGEVIPAVFSTASLKLTNNLREQAALGYEYMAGVGAGKVNVTLSGDIYFYNNDIFKKHLDNGRVSAHITLTGESETLEITLPKLAISAPSNNAQGENQDYKTSVTFNAEAGIAELNNGVQKECVIAFLLNPL